MKKKHNHNKASSQVQTVDRVSAILNCFSLNEAQLSMTEISKRIGLTTSTTHRLLSSLEQNGLLSRAPDGRRFVLGYHFLYWASIVKSSTSIQQQARPLLEQLAKITGETAVLTVREGNWAIYLDRVDSTQPLRQTMPIGQRIPLHAGSSAKILLAYLERDEIEQIIGDMGLPYLLTNTITEAERLHQELAKIRRQGYATSFEERDLGTAGLTAPVFSNGAHIVAGIGIVGPIIRLSPAVIESYIDPVTAIAQRLSRLQGAR